MSDESLDALLMVVRPSFRWQMIHGNILVRPLVAANMTQGGLVKPEISRDRPQFGIIEALDAGWDYTAPFQPGDAIAFGRFAGVEVEFDGAVRFLLSPGEVLARLPNPETVLHDTGEEHFVNERCSSCPS